jgi:hypothetical protein
VGTADREHEKQKERNMTEKKKVRLTEMVHGAG